MAPFLPPRMPCLLNPIKYTIVEFFLLDEPLHSSSLEGSRERFVSSAGQDDQERRSSARAKNIGTDADATAVLIDELFANPQTESRPNCAFCCVERFKDMLQRSWFDSFTVVCHGNSKLAGGNKLWRLFHTG